MSYKIKGIERARKVAKRRNAMVVSNRSIFVIQRVIGDKAQAVKAGSK